MWKMLFSFRNIRKWSKTLRIVTKYVNDVNNIWDDIPDNDPQPENITLFAKHLGYFKILKYTETIEALADAVDEISAVWYPKNWWHKFLVLIKVKKY